MLFFPEEKLLRNVPVPKTNGLVTQLCSVEEPPQGLRLLLWAESMWWPLLCSAGDWLLFHQITVSAVPQLVTAGIS